MDTTLLAAEGEHSPLAVEWPELILGLIVFGIVVALVAKFVVPNFEKAYAERTAAIEGGIEDAQQAQKEAQAALEKYNAQLAEARTEAARIREEAKEQGAQIVTELREQAKAEADRITAAAHAQVEAERAQVLAQLKAEVGDLATQLASRIVGESLEEEARQKRTVERFITELEGSAN
ncbi:F0F1 ATP synthase subunit B [Aeromicrobium sp. IC_218]|jgi:F-type H+-transporting ATPase subunit b|uniref:F0F1 ATP synthase subunit B n=1 Tax=Aeromicrobium sp. IC_218 TaxID=2545468 RepID=UPI00103B60A2|nr:F0F1 ATP synthase subunit B [Aeromicrobium sp. IC_218]TCI97494.1 F0F1 ATP synthase subunit B [Aeromicrobium sp. IC_218]